MIGMLDAYKLYGDPRYLDGYENVHRFVMDFVINHRVGEWYPLFDENNNRLWSYMGHAWKINYHTMRAAILCEDKLSKLIAASE
ncbi:MAG: hypothetical protein HC888_12000 [Candidatus Competibacteraceae bacterium]|nr:hypothetical protein [Candidatus Competibacteraceae bacterium]